MPVSHAEQLTSWLHLWSEYMYAHKKSMICTALAACSVRIGPFVYCCLRFCIFEGLEAVAGYKA